MSKCLNCNCSRERHTCNLLNSGPLVGPQLQPFKSFLPWALGLFTVFVRLSDAVTVWWNLFFIQCKLVWSAIQISDAVLLLEDVCNGGVRGVVEEYHCPRGFKLLCQTCRRRGFICIHRSKTHACPKVHAREADQQREALILMHVFRQSVYKTVWAHIQHQCVCCAVHPPSTPSWATGWFPFSLPSLQPSSGSLASSAADLITGILDNI